MMIESTLHNRKVFFRILGAEIYEGMVLFLNMVRHMVIQS